LPYYFNPETKESRWEPPSGTDTEKLKNYMATNHTPSARPDAAGQAEGKIRCSHLLVKHSGSRRPSSWREAEITRSKEEAIEILKGYEQRIQEGESLGDIAVSESDCSSARKKGDLYVLQAAQMMCIITNERFSGFFGHGEMQKEFEDAAFALQPGQVSSVVETASGVHLIQRYGMNGESCLYLAGVQSSCANLIQQGPVIYTAIY
jgi:NIMA-interacting peptidyl-prolyl cis-trans isomerase 1